MSSASSTQLLTANEANNAKNVSAKRSFSIVFKVSLQVPEFRLAPATPSRQLSRNDVCRSFDAAFLAEDCGGRWTGL